MLFSGDSFVTVPNSASLALTTGITLEAGVFPTASTGLEAVLMKEQTGSLVYALYASSSSSRPMAISIPGRRPTATATCLARRPCRPTPGVTWRRRTAVPPCGSTSMAPRSPASRIPAPSSPLRARSASAATRCGGEYFRGMIDEVRIYNRALAPAEILTDMKTGVGQ